MKTFLKVLKFAYRHSFRSGRLDFVSAFRMGMEVYSEKSSCKNTVRHQYIFLSHN